MRKTLTNGKLFLSGGSVASDRFERPRTLEVICGLVWVTVEGERADFWLHGGERMTVPRQRLVVIEAQDEPAVVLLTNALQHETMRGTGLEPFRAAAASASY
jgi:hypothetical protein